MDLLRVPIILFCFMVIAFSLTKGLAFLAIPAGALAYWLIDSDKDGAGIEGVFALIFGFIVVGGGIALIAEVFKFLFS